MSHPRRRVGKYTELKNRILIRHSCVPCEFFVRAFKLTFFQAFLETDV